MVRMLADPLKKEGGSSSLLLDVVKTGYIPKEYLHMIRKREKYNSCLLLNA